ncbi:hypothetical protein 110_00168 [Staphylococcus phage 110]|uniref:Uncharacterized protein n=2 Tax=Sepunavirus TaxID=1980928 RepID=W5R8Y4_9CAUD|nr:hypothetical protein FDH45_gp160 [Staphylococcus phage phiIBB-SEP1]AGR48288.1 hypothetical protein SEP1_161 [Staphylococcus phage phiIBB-SEP1]QLF86763.1 nuclease [Staphylococcus phage vB_SepM_BE04]QLF86946.1 hypothetical protein BESEP5_00004 [Staphylococcus phage vB_SepM_BE05]WJJ58332.1 hypothetical protein 110_00169 [Staphylococcus phage 110]
MSNLGDKLNQVTKENISNQCLSEYKDKILKFITKKLYEEANKGKYSTTISLYHIYLHFDIYPTNQFTSNILSHFRFNGVNVVMKCTDSEYPYPIYYEFSWRK